MKLSKEIQKHLKSYDEAELNKRITTGETADYWFDKMRDAEDELKNIIDDVGAVECARHMLFSPAL